MSHLQKNTIGLFPKINPITENISIDIIGSHTIRVNKLSNTQVKIYYKDILIVDTFEDIINLPEDFINFENDSSIKIDTFKTTLGYTLKGASKIILLNNLKCCSEEADVLIMASNNLLCI